MVDGERDQGDVVLGKGVDCWFSRVAMGGAADEFGANACKMRPKNISDGRVGLPSKVARDWGDGDIDTDGVDAGGRGGREIDGDVQRATTGLVSQTVLGFPVNVVLRAGEGGKGGEMLEENKERVPDVVVEGRLVALGEAAAEEVITVDVSRRGAVCAGCGGRE
jgi:hypothetical protein